MDASHMVSQYQLSPEKLEAGRACLNLLDEYGLGVQGATWLYIDSLREWRFFIITSLVDIDGLVKTFDRIERLFRIKFNNPDLLIDDIHLGSPDEFMFKKMAQTFSVSGGAEMDVTDVEIIDGSARIFIKRAYIYRLEKAPPRIKAKQARQKFEAKLKELERESID